MASSPGGPGVAVAIMAKAPRAGEVKTRLCPPLDRAQAAALYRCFLLDKIAQVRRLPGAAPAVAYAPAEARAVFEDLAPGFALIPQQGPDLGSRLAGAFEACFALGFAAALLVDSDTPTLPARLLAEAVQAIRDPRTDLVLGPTEDGGYYLIGLRRPHPALFRDMPWSTPAVMPETLGRARALGLTVRGLAPWFDVDTGQDLERLQAGLAAADGPEPAHTRAFLAGLRGGIPA